MPDSSVLRDYAVGGIPLGAWLDALNRRICEYVGRDARNLQIGHSYLLQGGRPVKDMSALRRALRDDILPLLEEYCYEDFSALQSILGNGLLDVDNQRIRHDLFKDGQEAALVQALMQPCPEVGTSAEAITADVLEEPVAEDDETDDAETDQ
jgi:5-methylcytosine-specific restriction protein B